MVAAVEPGEGGGAERDVGIGEGGVVESLAVLGLAEPGDAMGGVELAEVVICLLLHSAQLVVPPEADAGELVVGEGHDVAWFEALSGEPDPDLLDALLPAEVDSVGEIEVEEGGGVAVGLDDAAGRVHGVDGHADGHLDGLGIAELVLHDHGAADDVHDLLGLAGDGIVAALAGVPEIDGAGSGGIVDEIGVEDVAVLGYPGVPDMGWLGGEADEEVQSSVGRPLDVDGPFPGLVARARDAVDERGHPAQVVGAG